MQKLNAKTGLDRTHRAFDLLGRRLRREPRTVHLVPALLAAQANLREVAASTAARVQVRIEATEEANHCQVEVGDAIRGVDTAWTAHTNRKRGTPALELFPRGSSALIEARRAVLRADGRELVARVLGDPQYAALVDQARALDAALDRLDAALAAQAQATEAADRALLALRSALAGAKRTYNATVNQVVVAVQEEPGLAERLIPVVRAREKPREVDAGASASS